jgi:hypothetical protein
MVHANCRHLVSAYLMRAAFRQRMEGYGGLQRRRAYTEIGPHRSVEEMPLYLINNRLNAPDLERMRSAPKEIIRQIGQSNHMTDVGVTDQDVIDAVLGVKGKAGSYGTGIDQQLAIN